MARFSLLSRSTPSKDTGPEPEETAVKKSADPLEEKDLPTFEADDADKAETDDQKTDEPASFDHLEAKLRVHNKLIDEIDLSVLDKLGGIVL